MTGVYGYDMEPIVVQCRFCGDRQGTYNELVADHFIENGCSQCQQRFNAAAERLLEQVESLGGKPRSLPPLA